tara:strand:+ start:171 stop:1544 length:1374 start_codon:yes stop_codon:yes gene_type:complete
MSRILRRPMFRGGRVDSRGTGITSGLIDTSKPKRGLVNEPGGYAGEEFLIGEGMFSEFQRGKPGFSSPSNQSLATRGMNILQAAKNRVFGIPYLGKTLKTLSTPLRYASTLAMAPATLKTAAITAPFAAVGGLAYMNRPKTVEALQFMKSYGPLDETMTEDDYKQYYETIDTLNKNGTPLNQSEVGLLSSQKDIADAIEDKDMEEFEKQTSADLSADVKPGETAIDAVFREGEEKAKTRKEIENANKTPPPLTEAQIKEQLAKDKELFKELLGADKARGRDIGDLLASASASFLGTGQVKEGFADFMDKVSRSGESRTEKINRTAAGLAINDYIAGKRSKENLKQLLAKTKFGVDYGIEAAAAAKDLTTKEWPQAVALEADSLKENVSSNKVIKNALYKKFGKPAYVISGFENDSYGDIDTDDLKIGFNIISYAGGKIIIEKLSEESVRPRVDLPVS